MKRRILVLLGVASCLGAIYAQGEIDTQQRVFFRNEWSLAFMLNSNGFGGNYRYGQRINAADKRLYELDFAYMKDPKENKSNTRILNSTARYVEGKKNLAVNFRVGYGKQHEIYRRHDLGGVAIRRFHNYGAAVVLLKPIYYELGRYIGEPRLESIPPEKYNPEWTNDIYIIGRASFFKGFGEISAVPGVFGKFGFNFEFGTQDRIIHALEVGLIAEGFLQEIKIMDFTPPSNMQGKPAQNRQFFLTVFLSYRFGRIIDPYEVRQRRERSREISY